jgi:hypothetical protein
MNTNSIPGSDDPPWVRWRLRETQGPSNLHLASGKPIQPEVLAARAQVRGVLTAPYPEDPSGHLCIDGASLRVLQMFFGTDKIRFGVTSVRFPGETRYFDRFSEPLREIIDARIWASLHFRIADLQGQVLGMRVAHYMAHNYFQPLD